MKEDLAIARNSLMALQAENLALRRNVQQSSHEVKHENSNNVLDQIDPEVAQALATEKKKRVDVERELELQVYIFFFLERGGVQLPNHTKHCNCFFLLLR